ncbi:hypothetical protein PIB30_097007, partial [Stylosanthes scabra]|nr:hypothetical protein [Stylosanthes scabra]
MAGVGEIVVGIPTVIGVGTGYSYSATSYDPHDVLIRRFTGDEDDPTPGSRFSHPIHRGLGGTVRPPDLVLHNQRWAMMMMMMTHRSLPSQTLCLTPELIILCWRVRRRALRGRRQLQPRLVMSTSVRWDKVRKGTLKISWVYYNYYMWYVSHFSQALEHAVQFWWDRWRSFFRLQRGYELKIYESWRAQEAPGVISRD